MAIACSMLLQTPSGGMTRINQTVGVQLRLTNSGTTDATVQGADIYVSPLSSAVAIGNPVIGPNQSATIPAGGSLLLSGSVVPFGPNDNGGVDTTSTTYSIRAVVYTDSDLAQPPPQTLTVSDMSAADPSSTRKLDFSSPLNSAYWFWNVV